LGQSLRFFTYFSLLNAEHPFACSVFVTGKNGILGLMRRLAILVRGANQVALRAKAAKKSYTSPSFKVLDAAAARAELKAKGVPKDRVTQEMLSTRDCCR
jgi:hypothetical protein